MEREKGDRMNDSRETITRRGSLSGESSTRWVFFLLADDHLTEKWMSLTQTDDRCQIGLRGQVASYSSGWRWR